MAFVTGPALPSLRAARATSTCTVRMAADAAEEPVSRRAIIAGVVAAAAAAALPKVANAEREYPNVGFLGGSDVIDVNNANVRAYVKFQGFYPTLAGLIVANGPYKSVDELFALPDLTPQMKTTLEKYKDNLTALEPTPEYELDKFNNGLYR
ncbi:Photosystem II 12 kDa extrinsic protein, chloroplastic [Chondrus crispus]|uniref:Photosystem II 12 kDa extrinsic protein n=1 Tax=Chondrus crispus TaxID=2769 RepID=R7Q963_CHOCR|nr:Photosystem II 12 kDa extrinsic protein, chloroplastic [Chondrus crispus]CDF33931.1 Photosystem II 12 kDa extrinsic protein, chloroplastic [Chondrus crispus]|eukprot:XP_005713750.1 Photosystem II 12 kDa extrinsic protein, chloroplastic [Chondrus crispus]